MCKYIHVHVMSGRTHIHTPTTAQQGELLASLGAPGDGRKLSLLCLLHHTTPPRPPHFPIIYLFTSMYKLFMVNSGVPVTKKVSTNKNDPLLFTQKNFVKKQKQNTNRGVPDFSF